MLDICVPFWANEGFDSQTQLFIERTSLAGIPDVASDVRCMVQARQIYSLCTAGMISGKQEYLETALLGLDGLRRHFIIEDGRLGCYFSIHRNGEPADLRRDTYAHAFVILALAVAATAFKDPSLLRLTDNLLLFMDRELATGYPGSYLADNRTASLLERVQNPHMHLLEALLASEEASGTGRYLTRAESIVHLFQRRMFCHELGVLPEQFGPDWEQAASQMHLNWEPGHQFEWAWLLHWHASLAGSRVPDEASRLYQSGIQHGVDGRGVVDSVRGHLTPDSATYRLWPQCEFLKAVAVQSSLTDSTVPLCTSLSLVSDSFLGYATPGGWIDRLDASGMPASKMVPASSLYHLIMAMTEVERLSAKLLVST